MAAAGNNADDKPRCQTGASTEDTAHPCGCLVFLDDFYLAIRLALNDSGVIRIDQSSVGVESVDSFVVGQGILDPGVNAGVGEKSVSGHCRPPFRWCGALKLPFSRSCRKRPGQLWTMVQDPSTSITVDALRRIRRGPTYRRTCEPDHLSIQRIMTNVSCSLQRMGSD